MLRVVSTALAAAALAVALAPAASAHTDLVSSSPADGARLDRPPTQVALRFSEDVSARLAAVTLAVGGDDLGKLSVAQGTRSGEVVAAVPADALPTGPGRPAWSVSYRVTSADGHPIEGRLGFTAPLPAAPAPTSEPTTETATEPSTPATTTPAIPASGAADDGGSQTLATVVIGAIAAGGALVGCALLARSRRRADGS
ncbi:hypothetical protein GCM10027062_06480 [Nocardioides hungaricus]